MKLTFNMIGHSLQKVSKWKIVHFREIKSNQPDIFIDDIIALHKKNQKAFKRNLDKNTPGTIFADSVAAKLIKNSGQDIKEITLNLISKNSASEDYRSSHIHKIKRENGDLNIILEHGLIRASAKLTEKWDNLNVTWHKGILTVAGLKGIKMPETMVMSLKGNALTSVVDHPALEGMEIKYAGNNSNKLTLSTMEKIEPINLN